MLFCSMTFTFLYLPILCVIYFLSKQKYRNAILLISSIIFYAWGDSSYLSIMILSIIINWAGGLFIERNSGMARKKALWLTLSLNIYLLIRFKYFEFIIDNINNLFHTHIQIADILLPLGISFYTFQGISYIIDVYRGNCRAEKSLYKIALFICLFPQLIAGPIVKYHDIEKQIDAREQNFENVGLGVKRFIIGLSKKMIIANTLGLISNKIFAQAPDTFSPFIAWLGAISYSFQLYYDFSGYSDMAIGLGLIFGFKFMENFDYPYISKSITEFWRRWHISLSSWFKEYVYIPLGGNRLGKLKQFRNLGIVFLLTGIWHGASWHFAVWGIWHGLFIILEILTGLNKPSENKIMNFAKHIYCILVFVVGWVIFRADNMEYAWQYVMNMFGVMHLTQDKFIYSEAYYIDRYEIIIFIVALLCSTPVFKNMYYIENKVGKVLINTWLIILFIISTAAIAADTYNPFIYFRF